MVNIDVTTNDGKIITSAKIFLDVKKWLTGYDTYNLDTHCLNLNVDPKNVKRIEITITDDGKR